MSTSDNPRVQALLEDLETSDPQRFHIVQAVRALLRRIAPEARERVMYGGIMVEDGDDVCGVFAYRAHVSVEFGSGATMDDPHGVLEGSGKYRRHIKLRSPESVRETDLAAYLEQARGRVDRAD